MKARARRVDDVLTGKCNPFVKNDCLSIHANTSLDKYLNKEVIVH